MCPRHSIDFCPICGGGLCGIRIIGSQNATQPTSGGADDTTTDHPPPHGLVICDECEAVWIEPDVSTVHQYPDLENAVSPVSGQSLWGEGSRWANREEIAAFGWSEAVNPALDAEPNAELDDDQQVV